MPNARDNAPNPIATTDGRIGYIGVDVLNNATICNETTALREQGTDFDLVSVYQFDRPTYYQNETLAELADSIYHLYPMSKRQIVWDLIRAPFVFRFGFLLAVWYALTGKVEGWKQRLKTVAHLIPALRLAFHWKAQGVTHAHAQWAHTAATISMHAAEMLQIGFSFMGHANDLFVHRVALEDKVKRARFILCISEYHRRFYLNLGADPKRLHVVYCGISLDRFHNSNEDQSLTVSAPPRIVSIGRLVEKKGFDDLIRSCALLRDRGQTFACVIAGSGPQEDELRKLVADLQLDGLVEITGQAVLQEEMPQLLRSAQVFALPCVVDGDGDMDGLPQVLIEAMACKLPTVSTHLVGIPDLVRHNENGLLVETRRPAQVADAMQLLLDDPERGRQLGENGCEWVHDHFGRAELAERVGKLLQWAAETSGRATPTWQYEPAPGSAACYDEPRVLTKQEVEQASVALTV